MKIVGLITEYNPFHNGHLLHLTKAKETTKSNYAVIVMSGNYVQRGEPAIVDKYTRTKMALQNGADLVLELPVYYATASAEFFAYGAVSLLEATKIVSCVCFGSETGDLNQLIPLARILESEPDEYKRTLKQQLRTGLSYPVARQNALLHSMPNTAALTNPNDILAIEYLKALYSIRSPMIPYTIQRKHSQYNSLELSGAISSATAIRRAILTDFTSIYQKMPMPTNCLDLLANPIQCGYSPVVLDDFRDMFHYAIRSQSPQELREILDVSEGLENRIIKTAGKLYSLPDIIADIKTKRYTLTKIQRMILHIILNISRSDFQKLYERPQGHEYIRILGFKKESSFLLNELRKKSELPVITKTASLDLDTLAHSVLQKEIDTTDLYYLAKNKIQKKSIEHTIPLVIV